MLENKIPGLENKGKYNGKKTLEHSTQCCPTWLEQESEQPQSGVNHLKFIWAFLKGVENREKINKYHIEICRGKKST